MINAGVCHWQLVQRYWRPSRVCSVRFAVDHDLRSGGLGPQLAKSKNPALAEALQYLTANPPKVQLYEDQRAVFRDRPLPDADLGTQALESAKRVRNNLFHGGKHTGHKAGEERDETLLRHAALVIEETAKLDDDFYWDYQGIA